MIAVEEFLFVHAIDLPLQVDDPDPQLRAHPAHHVVVAPVERDQVARIDDLAGFYQVGRDAPLEGVGGGQEPQLGPKAVALLEYLRLHSK